MGFKLASLFVTVEAQAQKFAAQMGAVTKTAADAGREVAGTDFTPDASKFATAFAVVPGLMARAMAPVAGEVGGALKEAFVPVTRSASLLEATFGRIARAIERVGLAIVRYYRFDIALAGLNALKAAVDSASAHMVGRARTVARVFGNVINVGIITIKIKKIQRTLDLLLTPARKLIGVMAGVAAAMGRAAIGAVKLGTGFNFAKGMAGQLKSAVAGIAAASVVLLIAGAIYKVGQFFKDAVTGASDLGETLDKVDDVLGDAAPAVRAFADELAAKFGLVKRVTLDAASGFAGLAKGLGKLKGDKLSEFSIRMTQLAADFSSFANIDFDEAQKSIKIGLTGEPSDVLKQFGVVVNEATTKQYALAHGMKMTNGHLTEQQKLMARAGLIARQLADADKNLEITQGSTANRARKVAGQFTNLAATIGQSLLPVVNKALELFSQLALSVGRAFEANKAAIEGFVARMVVGFETVGSLFRNWRTTLEIARLYTFQALANIGEYFAVLGPNIATVAAYIGRNWVGLIRDAFNATVALLKNLWKNFQAVGKAIGEWMADPTKGFHVDWTPMLDGFKGTVEKFPELLKPHLHDMSAQIAAEQKKILDDVAARTRKGPEVKPKKGVAVDTPDVEEKGKKTGQVGDVEAFARSIQEAVTGKGHVEQAQLKALERIGKATEKIASNGPVAGPGLAVGPGWQAAGLA